MHAIDGSTHTNSQNSGQNDSRGGQNLLPLNVGHRVQCI